ncbi:MAG: hypothetical protein ACI9LE_001365, partial [Paraglaciecola sp.]
DCMSVFFKIVYYQNDTFLECIIKKTTAAPTKYR